MCPIASRPKKAYEKKVKPSSSPRSWGTLLVVGIGTLLGTLASSTINLALPQLGQDFHLSIQLSRWIMLAYFLTLIVGLPVSGRLSDLWGHRTLYQVGFVTFGIISLAGGLAQTYWMLIAARVLQAIGGAMVLATGPALLTTSFPAAQRGRALGILATATYVGLTIGPPVGGWLLATLSWRWIFYINVPIAALVFMLGQFFLPRQVQPAPIPFDGRGAITLLLGLPALALVATEGTTWGWLSWPSVGLLVLGGVFFSSFVLVELRAAHPLVDLHLFRSRVFTGATVSALCNYIALFVPIILLPFYMLEALHFSPGIAGLVLSAEPLAMALVASPAGWISDRIGTRGLATTGMLVLSIGLVGLSTCGPASSHGVLALWLAVAGIGTGIFISPNSSALMGAAPRGQQGVAGAVMALARTLGMMVGITMGTALFQAAGGRTGHVWQGRDFSALKFAFLAAGVVSLLGAVAAFLLRSASQSTAPPPDA